MAERAHKAPPVSPFAIRSLRRGEHALIGGIIDEAFRDDPVTRWTVGGRSTAHVVAALAKALYLRAGFGHVSEGGEGGALWLPPGAARTVDAWTSLALGARILRLGGVGALRRALAADAAVAAWTPEESHFYLFAIAVRPGAQRRGLGRALMETALARCDAEGAPAHLECSREANLGFYERLGFAVRGRIELARGGPPLWLMRRAPRSPPGVAP